MRDAISEDVTGFMALMSDNEWHFVGRYHDYISAKVETDIYAECIGLTVKEVMEENKYHKMLGMIGKVSGVDV